MKKYKVAVYKVPDDYMTTPYDIIWDYDCIGDFVEGESPDEVEEYVRDYLQEWGEEAEKFIIKTEEII